MYFQFLNNESYCDNLQHYNKVNGAEDAILIMPRRQHEVRTDDMRLI
jgi:hypothetical protein